VSEEIGVYFRTLKLYGAAKWQTLMLQPKNR
jgi:hypothetical protein